MQQTFRYEYNKMRGVMRYVMSIVLVVVTACCSGCRTTQATDILQFETVYASWPGHPQIEKESFLHYLNEMCRICGPAYGIDDTRVRFDESVTKQTFDMNAAYQRQYPYSDEPIVESPDGPRKGMCWFKDELDRRCREYNLEYRIQGNTVILYERKDTGHSGQQ